jgi:hypothetical protein
LSTPHQLALWIIRIGVPLSAMLILIAAIRGRLRPIYHQHFRETPRERLFLASVGFFLTFAVVRTLTWSIHIGIGPFHDVVSSSGRHIHHMVWGILLLLLVGYCFLIQVGVGEGQGSKWVARIASFAYGVGAALTLDEFALWLNLRDVYWSPEGRISINAVFFFGGLLMVGIWGGRFFHALSRDLFGRPLRPQTK